jgi:uncharacterized membrane protein
MTLYFLVKYLHVLGAIVILGTGAGIAFFMLMAHRSRDAAFIARTAGTSLGLYAVAGLFWVPVIFMQIEMRDLAAKAAEQNQKLPPRYFALFHRWFLFGIPGFGAVMAILWLMIAKPL